MTRVKMPFRASIPTRPPWSRQPDRKSDSSSGLGRLGITLLCSCTSTCFSRSEGKGRRSSPSQASLHYVQATPQSHKGFVTVCLVSNAPQCTVKLEMSEEMLQVQQGTQEELGCSTCSVAVSATGDCTWAYQKSSKHLVMFDPKP